MSLLGLFAYLGAPGFTLLALLRPIPVLGQGGGDTTHPQANLLGPGQDLWHLPRWCPGRLSQPTKQPHFCSESGQVHRPIPRAYGDCTEKGLVRGPSTRVLWDCLAM